MWIKSLKLFQFRNYQSVSLEFERGVNYIVGANGAGKTSLVEAIGMLPLCKSIRSADEKEVIRIGCDFSRIEALVQKKNPERMKLVISSQGKLIESNGTEVKKVSDIAGIVKTVSFLPKDVELFHEAPARRRRFLDSSMSMLDRQYLMTLGEYNRYLEELRALLKKGDPDPLYLEVLAREMSKRGESISRRRRKFLELLNEELTGIATYLEEGQTKLQLKYLPDIDARDEESYCAEVCEKIRQQQKNFPARITVHGAHSDDLAMLHNGKDLALYGSQGQNRISVIALKLALFKLIREKFYEEPIVILDDVLSELDSDHQKRLIGLLNRIEQVFITGTKAEVNAEYALYGVKENEIRRIR